MQHQLYMLRCFSDNQPRCTPQLVSSCAVKGLFRLLPLRDGLVGYGSFGAALLRMASVVLLRFCLRSLWAVSERPRALLTKLD